MFIVIKAQQEQMDISGLGIKFSTRGEKGERKGGKREKEEKRRRGFAFL